MLQEFNTMQPKLKFTLETETQNKINYHDIKIKEQHNKLKFGIYCKPTTANTIIHDNLCHLKEHKRLAINNLTNHKNTYQLTSESKVQENAIINEILINNRYRQQITYQKHKHKPSLSNTT
jgi:outer membrane lipopolysaccharide assembly protein LptE/RlpB